MILVCSVCRYVAEGEHAEQEMEVHVEMHREIHLAQDLT